MRILPAVAFIIFAGGSAAGCVGGMNQAGGQSPFQAPAALAPPPGSITAGVVGSSIGLSLSEADRNRALRAEYDALENGVAGAPVLWQGGARTIYGEVVPGPLYSVNQYECRDYTHTIYVDGVREAGRGTSCRVAGGPWGPVI